MAYSELIKDFKRIREYMRDFYLYGFNGRNGYNQKSARSYDNERRRIESWLGEYMAFRNEQSGKKAFISMDSSELSHNPIYMAFKTKSFTTNDINLHFYILDILKNGKHTSKEVLDLISSEYLSLFEDSEPLDESTVRKKLNEYVEVGLVSKETKGKTVVYSLPDKKIDLDEYKDAINFFSEIDPLGVIGSYLLDRTEVKDCFKYKHHYLLNALVSEIMFTALTAIKDKHDVSIQVLGKRRKTTNETLTHEVFPIRIYISSQTGRRYLLAYTYSNKRMMFFRLDNIKSIKIEAASNQYDEIFKKATRFESHLWGAASSNTNLQHIEMTLYIDDNSTHILNRLEREKRNGKIEQIDENLYKYSTDTYDSWELVPWMRSFIGRIVEVTSTDKDMEDSFKNDIKRLYEIYGIYGGSSDDI